MAQARIFEKGEFNRFMAAVENERHRLIFAIAAATGERIGAILQLNTEDCYYCDGLALKPRERILFRGETRKQSAGKKADDRSVIVSPTLKTHLRAYAPTAKTGYLFPGSKGAVGYRAIDYALKRAVGRAKLREGLSTHSFRRTAATNIAEAGCDVRTLQTAFGWKTPTMAIRYIESNPKKVDRAMLNSI